MVRRFTVEEDAQLLGLEKAQLKVSEMARLLGRPANSIRGRLMTLARRDAREERAQEKAAGAMIKCRFNPELGNKKGEVSPCLQPGKPVFRHPL